MTQDELTKLQEEEALRKVDEWQRNKKWLEEMELEKQKADQRFYDEQRSSNNGASN